jgi:hypothetical protein
MDLLWLIIIFCLFILLFAFVAIFAGIAIFWQELSFVPRKSYVVRIFNRDTNLDKDVFVRNALGWVVVRKLGVKKLRVAFGIFSGLDMDIGYMRHMSKIQDGKGKEIFAIDLREKIPGVRDEANFEPLILPFDMDLQIERGMRHASVSLTEISQRLNVFKGDSPDELKVLAAALQSAKDSLNHNIDKILDQDRRIQAAQVSGWSEFAAVGMEKSAYRVQKDDPLMKMMPYIAIFAIIMLIFFVMIFLGDFASKTISENSGQVVSACHDTTSMYVQMAKSCGWVPPESINATAPPPDAPAGLIPGFG